MSYLKTPKTIFVNTTYLPPVAKNSKTIARYHQIHFRFQSDEREYKITHIYLGLNYSYKPTDITKNHIQKYDITTSPNVFNHNSHLSSLNPHLHLDNQHPSIPQIDLHRVRTPYDAHPQEGQRLRVGFLRQG